MSVSEITPAEFLARRARGDVMSVLDVREEWELKVSSVPGLVVVHIPMSEVAARVSELDSSTEIVVLCRSGRRSLEIANLLQQRGLRTVNLAGGILAWSRDVDPSIPTY